MFVLCICYLQIVSFVSELSEEESEDILLKQVFCHTTKGKELESYL